MSSVPEVRNPLLGAGEVIWKPEYSSNTGSRGNRGNPYQWAFGYPNAMLAGTSAATQGRQGRAIPHPLPGAGIRPRRPGSWPRSEQQQRQDHRQPVGIVSRLDTAQGCSSTQAAHQASRAGPGPHPLPGAGIGPRRPGNWPQSEQQQQGVIGYPYQARMGSHFPLLATCRERDPRGGTYVQFSETALRSHEK